MSEPENRESEPEQKAPILEAESRFRRGIRYSHRTGLYASFVVAIAAFVFLILLIARNTRQVPVDYVFGSTLTRLVFWAIRRMRRTPVAIATASAP